MEFKADRMDNGNETPRNFYRKEPRKALWDYWNQLGKEVWERSRLERPSSYPEISYAHWFAEAMRNKFIAWKDYRTQSLADDVREGAD